MGRYYCVLNCKNNDKSKACFFYAFLTVKHKLQQRIKWIAAIKRSNPDGTLWRPRKFDVACSEHFVGNKKSDVVLSPSYSPTIFPDIYRTKKVSESTVNRFTRFMKQRRSENSVQRERMETSNIDNDRAMEHINIEIGQDSGAIQENKKEDKACQLYLYNNDKTLHTICMCNRMIGCHFNDAEVQVYVAEKNGYSLLNDNTHFLDLAGVSIKKF